MSVVIIEIEKLEEILKGIVSTEVEEAFKKFKGRDTEYVSRADAAKLLGVTPETIRQYTKKGYIKKYYIGRTARYKKEELLNGLEWEKQRI